MAAVRMADLPTTNTDVLVVGAGPTGLMAGLVLTRRGVPVVVLDQKAGPTRESSRAPMSNCCPAAWRRQAPKCCGGTGWST